jgi:ribosomal protein S12 methylthiotransferase accessory factor
MENFEVSFPGGLRVAANYRGFTIDTDQPLGAGGDNTAPSPFELFLASLATCAGFFVVSFCQQRGIPTEDIKVVQRMERDPATHLVSKVAIDIQLPAGFPEQYRAAVVRAADLCTVKRHLQNPPLVEVNATTVAAPANVG